jgi:hypothetical protein
VVPPLSTNGVFMTIPSLQGSIKPATEWCGYGLKAPQVTGGETAFAIQTLRSAKLPFLQPAKIGQCSAVQCSTAQYSEMLHLLPALCVLSFTRRPVAM